MSAKKFSSKEIISDETLSERRGTADSEEVRKVYDELATIEKPRSVSFVSRPVVSAVLGLAAGVVGAALVFGDAFGITSRLVNSESGANGRTIILERRERVDVPWEESKGKVYSQISRSVHGVYRLKKDGDASDVVKLAYFPEDQTGSAIAVTSDGWLVAARDAVKEKSSYGILVSGRVYPIEKTVVDPFSDLAFVKAGVQTLQPVRFSSVEADLGTIGIVGSVRGSDFQGELAGLTRERARSISSKNPYESSERNSSFFTMGGDRGMGPGSGAFNVSGDLMGVHDGINGFVRASRIIKALSEVLKEGKVGVTTLGVTVLDLGYVGIDQRAITAPLQGARIQSIATGSSASHAKLQVGDVILKIEDESLTGEKSVSELIQEYQPGTKVSLEILRNADTLDVEVTLGKQ